MTTPMPHFRPFRFLLLAILGATSPALAIAQIPVQTSVQNATPLGRTIPGRFLVSYRDGVLPAAASQIAGANVIRLHQSLGMAVLQTTPELAASTRARLAADPAVAFVVEDRVVAADALRTRPAPAIAAGAADAIYHSPQGWAVRQVGGFGDAATPGPWNQTTGAGIRIAILDSGIDASHPDLAPNLALNLSEVDQHALPSACDNGSPQDQQGHGTWTASLAAAALGPDTGLVAGVAPSATLLNIKVLERMPGTPTADDPSGCNSGQASGLLSWVIAGIDDAVSNHASIISMSLGTLIDITTGDGAGLKALFDQTTHAAANAGVLLVASAGNDGFNLANQRYIELPAQSRDVLAILASTNPDCAENLVAGATCAPGPVTLPYYSNYGAPLNALAAPGGSYPAPSSAATTEDPAHASGWIWGACSIGISSTLTGPPADSAHSYGCFGLGHVAYVQAMGTSASAPLAAGAAALIRAANPTWTPSAVIAALRASATPVHGLPVGIVTAAPLLTVANTHMQVSQHIDAGPQR
jgi:subtilisin family serine protease